MNILESSVRIRSLLCKQKVISTRVVWLCKALGFSSSKKKILKEELSNKDLDNIRLLIRYEVAQIMFDLYRKRKVWGA